MNRKFVIAGSAAFAVVGLLIYSLPKTSGPKPTPEPASPPDSDNSSPPARQSQPAGPVVVAPAPEPARKTNSLSAQLLRGEDLPKLTPAQLGRYLDENHRNAEGLLAAFRTSGDTRFLDEALEKFPNDPRVNYAAIFRDGGSPEQRRASLDAFKRSDPNNALPNYLSASDYFKAGQKDQALAELNESAGKTSWADYSEDFLQNAEEAYRSAGYSDAESKVVAAWSLLLPDLAPVRQLGRDLGALAKNYQQEGDQASAQAALETTLRIGQQFASTQTQPLITTLVGFAIQNQALSAMDPTAPYGDSGQTVQDRMNELKAQRDSIKSLTQQSSGLMETMAPEDLMSYFDRRRSFGEVSAMQWALNKFGKQ
jgi:hypothetical protein